jgi:hypothetical protein
VRFLLWDKTLFTGMTFVQAYFEQQARHSLTLRLDGKMLNDSLFSFRFMVGYYRESIRRPQTVSRPRYVWQNARGLCITCLMIDHWLWNATALQHFAHWLARNVVL